MICYIGRRRSGSRGVRWICKRWYTWEGACGWGVRWRTRYICVVGLGPLAMISRIGEYNRMSVYQDFFTQPLAACQVTPKCLPTSPFPISLSVSFPLFPPSPDITQNTHHTRPLHQPIHHRSHRPYIPPSLPSPSITHSSLNKPTRNHPISRTTLQIPFIAPHPLPSSVFPFPSAFLLMGIL